MQQGTVVFDAWAFIIPNFILAMLMYTLLARFLLSLFFQPESDRVIWRTFKTITDPFVATTQLITPRLVPERLVVLFSVIWVLLARLGLFLTFLAAGYKLSPGS